MRQPAVIAGAVLAAFVFWLAAHDRLKVYLGMVGL